MKSSLNAATLSQSLPFEEFVRVAGAAGFAGVEVRLAAMAKLVDERGLDAARRLFDDAGVAPTITGLGPSFLAPDRDLAAGFARMPEQCALAVSLGIRAAMVVLPF